MTTLDKTAWEILNATADDLENLEQIYLQVCYQLMATPGTRDEAVYDYRPIRGAPLLSEIADRIRGLVDQGLLAVAMDEDPPGPDRDGLSYIWRAWFRMTPQGRSIWESSEHFVEQEFPQ